MADHARLLHGSRVRDKTISATAPSNSLVRISYDKGSSRSPSARSNPLPNKSQLTPSVLNTYPPSSKILLSQNNVIVQILLHIDGLYRQCESAPKFQLLNTAHRYHRSNFEEHPVYRNNRGHCWCFCVAVISIALALAWPSRARWLCKCRPQKRK